MQPKVCHAHFERRKRVSDSKFSSQRFTTQFKFPILLPVHGPNCQKSILLYHFLNLYARNFSYLAKVSLPATWLMRVYSQIINESQNCWWSIINAETLLKLMLILQIDVIIFQKSDPTLQFGMCAFAKLSAETLIKGISFVSSSRICFMEGFLCLSVNFESDGQSNLIAWKSSELKEELIPACLEHAKSCESVERTIGRQV